MTGDGDFSLAGVLAEARRETGLSEFGDDGFREGLGVLLETYERTARFDARGRADHRRRVVTLLCARLRVVDALNRHPEVRGRAIRSPVFVTGLPRTGTSALFQLLAADPAARPLLTWEAIHPYPLEDLRPGDPDPRREAAGSLWIDAGFEKIHHVGPDLPEECVLLLSQDFCDPQMGIEVLMEPYASWFQAQDLRRSYAYYADLLRLLDWQRPGERWLLKSPVHLWALDVVLEAFPDACIVLNHREPLECVASYCSMIAFLMRDRASFEPAALGPEVLEYLARSLERALAAREQADPRRFVDVDYRDLLEDPLAEVECIYRRFGLPLGSAAREAMLRHLRENPKDKHGAHAYRLEDYGLTPERVRARLAAYLERFGLERGGGGARAARAPGGA